MSEAQINSFVVGGEAAAEAARGTEETPPEQDHSLYWQHQQKAQEGLNAKAELVAQIQDPTERKRAAETLADRAQEASEELESWYKGQLEGEIDRQEKRLFHTTPTERDAVRAAFADVEDRVAFAQLTGEGAGSIEDRDEALEEIYQRAVRTGDRALQKACYHYALLNGIASIRDSYLETSEEKTRAWQDYNIARRRLDDWTDPREASWRRMTGTQGFSRPEELR